LPADLPPGVTPNATADAVTHRDIPGQAFKYPQFYALCGGGDLPAEMSAELHVLVSTPEGDPASYYRVTQLNYDSVDKLASGDSEAAHRSPTPIRISPPLSPHFGS
jgi:hypothetical protein